MAFVFRFQWGATSKPVDVPPIDVTPIDGAKRKTLPASVSSGPFFSAFGAIPLENAARPPFVGVGLSRVPRSRFGRALLVLRLVIATAVAGFVCATVLFFFGALMLIAIFVSGGAMMFAAARGKLRRPVDLERAPSGTRLH